VQMRMFACSRLSVAILRTPENSLPGRAVAL